MSPETFHHLPAEKPALSVLGAGSTCLDFHAFRLICFRIQYLQPILFFYVSFILLAENSLRSFNSFFPPSLFFKSSVSFSDNLFAAKNKRVFRLRALSWFKSYWEHGPNKCSLHVPCDRPSCLCSWLPLSPTTGQTLIPSIK